MQKCRNILKIENGLKFNRIIYRITVNIQLILWVLGISIHNMYGDECCPDFSCCVPELKEKSFIKRLKYMLRYYFVKRGQSNGIPKTSK